MKGRIIVDTSFPNHSIYLTDDHTKWREFYSDAEEEIPSNLPTSKGAKGRMTVYMYAYHTYDLVIRKSIMVDLIVRKSKHFQWISKRQTTVETSIYGSDLVTSKKDTELILEVRCMLWWLRVSLKGRKMMFEDSMSVKLNITG
jgi:hypothetical protein